MWPKIKARAGMLSRKEVKGHPVTSVQSRKLFREGKNLQKTLLSGRAKSKVRTDEIKLNIHMGKTRTLPKGKGGEERKV